MALNISNAGAAPKAAPAKAPAVKSPVRPGTAGYGVLATPVVPRGQLSLRTQPTAPVAHQAGPRATPEHRVTPQASPRPTGPLLIKAEHGKTITPADQTRANAAAALLAEKIKLNTPVSHHDGGFDLGTIFAPASIAHTAESLGEGALKGIASGAGAAAHGVGSLGSSFLQGGEALGLAALHDVTHPKTWNTMENNFGSMPHTQSALSQAAQGMAKSDPLAALIVNQDPAEALHAAVHNPVNAGLDLLGGLGAAGRAAGVASDLAKAHDAGGVLAARAARLERDPQILHAGVTEPRAFSTNLMVAAAQKAADEGKLGQLGQRLVNGDTSKILAKRATEHHAATIAVETRTAIRAEKAGRKAGLEGEALRKHVALAQNGVTAELHDRAIAENAIGNRPYASLRAARGARTRLTNAMGIDPQTFTVVKSVMKKGEPAHNWLARTVPEGAQVDAHEFKLIPSSFANRMTEHYTKQHDYLEVPLPGGHHVSMANFTRQFRNTVLPFSSKWFAGNVIEGGLRNSLRGVLPTDPLLAHRALSAMEGQGHSLEADVLRGHAMGGLNYGMQERLSNEVKAARGGKPSLPGRAIEAYNKNIPERIFIKNRQAEQGITSATLGRFMRMHMHNVGQVATPENIAREFTKPEVARAAGRYTRHVLGKYDAFSPKSERFIRNMAPFAPWYMNAAKFVGKDLPLGRPLTSAGLLASHSATGAAWQKAHSSNNPDLQTYLGGIPGGSLANAIKEGPSKYLDLGRFMPFGAFNDSPVNVALQTLAPELQGPVRSYLGQDPFGSDLYAPGAASRLTPTGRVSKATKHRVFSQSSGAQMTALSSILSEILGPAEAAHRIGIDQGATPYNTEKLWDIHPTMKPGTQRGPRNPLSGINRVLNPFFPVVTRPAKAKKTGSSNTLGGGSSGGSHSSGGNFL